jgi:hypothetical protein
MEMLKYPVPFIFPSEKKRKEKKATWISLIILLTNYYSVHNIQFCRDIFASHDILLSTGLELSRGLNCHIITEK